MIYFILPHDRCPQGKRSNGKYYYYISISQSFQEHIHKFNGSSLAVFLYLASFANDKLPYCWPNYDDIVKHTGYHEKPVSRALRQMTNEPHIARDGSRRLEPFPILIDDKPVLKIEKLRLTNRRSSNLYIVLPDIPNLISYNDAGVIKPFVRMCTMLRYELDYFNGNSIGLAAFLTLCLNMNQDRVITMSARDLSDITRHSTKRVKSALIRMREQPMRDRLPAILIPELTSKPMTFRLFPTQKEYDTLHKTTAVIREERAVYNVA